jgi:uncharacterized protein (DUF4415 family)
LGGVDLKIDAVRDLLGTNPIRYLARESATTGRAAFTDGSGSVRGRRNGDCGRKTLDQAAKQAAGDDSDINYSDIPRLTDAQLAQMVRLRDIRPKVPVSVRLDPSVLAWLRSKGGGHLTRINDILRNIMEAEQRIAQR